MRLGAVAAATFAVGGVPARAAYEGNGMVACMPVSGTPDRLLSPSAVKGERLLRVTHPIGIDTDGVPSGEQRIAARLAQVVRSRRVHVSATRRGLLASICAEVQIQAERPK